MTSPFVRAILASCALACAAAPALADSIVAGGSSAGVSASSAGSISLKGSSNSIEGASGSLNEKSTGEMVSLRLLPFAKSFRELFYIFKNWMYSEMLIPKIIL